MSWFIAGQWCFPSGFSFERQYGHLETGSAGVISIDGSIDGSMTVPLEADLGCSTAPLGVLSAGFGVLTGASTPNDLGYFSR